ncbi:hypothetical protein [Paraburkholderia terricola]|uniref:RsiW-degrading membrane proteinase PrsW (M82 family) n=1 Tax=Paraburkholderia terricola TaxID=169427 RepID=A0ABU1M0A1_9BURK|nr:hypothetical protein [Paraburkholderia terricola]MDR6412438.1 RsiW-degrading membrane proteinase PrsW (M82 family) [Paraburkholderia terricola]MDR6481113.1 RsiW-degrading membrane proteinase PrsW (M82 family) [Paraburkholderia terricola]
MIDNTQIHPWHAGRSRMLRLCERTSRLALYILPASFLLFLGLLFFIWYRSDADSWLIVIGAVLTCAMVMVTAMVATASLVADGYRCDGPSKLWPVNSSERGDEQSARIR